MTYMARNINMLHISIKPSHRDGKMKKDGKIQLNYVVAKANSLVPKLARYELQELRLIAYCLAHYDSRQPNNRRFTARVEDLARIFPMNSDGAYEVIKKVVSSINSKPIEFRDSGGKYYSVLFSSFYYRENEGAFDFMLSQAIEPFVLELRERFSAYRLGDVHGFKSASSWLLYEHLNVYKYTGSWLAPLDELRECFGVAGKYERLDSLRHDLVDPAMMEINQKSNLNVEYVKEREGRKVVALRFFIKTREKIYLNEKEHDKNMLLRLLLQAGIRRDTSEKLLQKMLSTEKEKHFLQKLPEIMNRWNEAKGPMARYVTGALKSEIYDVNRDSKPYAEAYRCWAEKKIAQTKCQVRARGKVGNRHKCKMCFQYMPVETYGI